MSNTKSPWLSWTTLAPVAAIVVLALAWGRHPGTVAAVAVGIFLIGAVLSAVHHAEVVAHRVGEPFGSLLLAVAVTVIEVALIVTLMVGGSGDTSALARDTVFAAVMITLNGIVGLSLLIAAVKYRMAVFNPEGAGSALMTVVALATLTLVLPRFTTIHPGPEFSAVAARPSPPSRRSALYGIFVFTQTVKHRDFFLAVATGPGSGSVDRADRRAGRRGRRRARGPAERPGRAGQPRAAAARPGRGRRPGQGRVLPDRGRRRRSSASRTPSSVS